VTTFRDKPTLRGERVVLRPIVAGDAASMWADLADEEALRLTGTTRTFTREQIDEWVATRAEADDRWDLAVVDAVTGEWLGEAVINGWEPAHRSCSFRIALGPHARDRGIGTEATRLIVDAVFDLVDDPPVHRLSLEVYAFNPRAIAVYERVGFRREGVLRDALRWNGGYVDAIVMSIVRTDRA
jgi:RimJ/RimL family protein N-acetyltransferase